MKEHDPETYALIGDAMTIHKELGCGFLENVYQDAYEIELNHLAIPFKREDQIRIQYRNQFLKSTYRLDFLCYETTIIELKAISTLTSIEESQVINYLNASKLKKALLFNFGSKTLEFKRFVL